MATKHAERLGCGLLAPVPWLAMPVLAVRSSYHLLLCLALESLCRAQGLSLGWSMLSSLAPLKLGATSQGCGGRQEPTWCLLVLLTAVLFAPIATQDGVFPLQIFLGKTGARGLKKQPVEVIREGLGVQVWGLPSE